MSKTPKLYTRLRISSEVEPYIQKVLQYRNHLFFGHIAKTFRGKLGEIDAVANTKKITIAPPPSNPSAFIARKIIIPWSLANAKNLIIRKKNQKTYEQTKYIV